MKHPLRHHKDISHTAFGEDWFGKFAEKFALFLGTPQYLISQTIIVLLWIFFNGYSIFVHFDPYPFIALNLLFSTQASYAAPLILLAQTRQAERDKEHMEADAIHREDIAINHTDMLNNMKQLLEQNTKLTEEIHKLQNVIYDHINESN